MDLDGFMAQLDRLSDDPSFIERLRSHRTVAGIAGSIAPKIAERMVSERQARESKETFDKRIKQMMKDAEAEAQRAPGGFADNWLKGMKKDRNQQAEQAVRMELRQEFGQRVGAAVASIPEFKQLTADEVAWIAGQLSGRSEDEVVAVYTAAVVDKIADKRAAARLEAQYKERYEKDRKADKAAENAKRVAAQQSPGLAKPSRGSVDTMPDWNKDPDAWNKAYEERFLGKRSKAGWT